VRTRLAFGAFFATATAIVTLSLAQPRRPAPAAKPKPSKSADSGGGGSEPMTADELAIPPSAKDAPPSDGGVLPSAVPTLSFYDGGQKPSPLNPAPNELPSGAPPAPSAASVDYDKLLGDISTLRARIATVGDSLFHSRIAIAIQTEGDHARIQHLTVSLDDGVVYTAQPNFRPEDMTTVYDHAVAPGRHAVTIDIERKDDREETFRTAQRSRMIVDVPKDQRLSLEVRILDDSTMGGDFPGDKSGRYDLRVRAKALAKPVQGK
jgi:hypothetical protein